MKDLPENVAAYKRTPSFTEATVPPGLLKNHSTIEGAWAKIVIEEGSLKYTIQSDPPEQVILSPERCGIVEPRVLHQVEPLGKVVFHVEFYRVP